MKKYGLGIALAAALMLALSPVLSVQAAEQKRLSQGFMEEVGKIGKTETGKTAKKKKKKKAKKKAMEKKAEPKKEDKGAMKKKDDKKK